MLTSRSAASLKGWAVCPWGLDPVARHATRRRAAGHGARAVFTRAPRAVGARRPQRASECRPEYRCGADDPQDAGVARHRSERSSRYERSTGGIPTPGPGTGACPRSAGADPAGAASHAGAAHRLRGGSGALDSSAGADPAVPLPGPPVAPGLGGVRRPSRGRHDRHGVLGLATEQRCHRAGHRLCRSTCSPTSSSSATPTPRFGHPGYTLRRGGARAPCPARVSCHHTRLGDRRDAMATNSVPDVPPENAVIRRYALHPAGLGINSTSSPHGGRFCSAVPRRAACCLSVSVIPSACRA